MANKLSFIDLNPDDTNLLPNFCDAKVLFMLVLLVEMLALVLTATPSTVNFWDQLAFLSMLMLWIGLLNAAVLCLLRARLNTLSKRSCLITSFSLMMLVSLVVCLMLLAINDWMQLDDMTSPLGDYFLLRIMLMSAVIYAVVLRYFYVQQQWKYHIQAKSKAEIQALRARIRPHFLFNSMNTIASLIAFSPDKAEKAIEDLSDLFRASLHERNNNSLADELALTRSYLDIETLRLGERLNIDWQVDESLIETEVPALCLQPLVENAIYHGIEPLAEGGSISITAQQKDNKLELSVSNPLADRKLMNHQGNHMAQENIQQRLALAYGNSASFNIVEHDHTYSVVLQIPLETARI